MNGDDEIENEEEEWESESYLLSDRDHQLIGSAVLLLEKLLRARVARPAEIVSVAKALHVLKMLPRVSSGMTVSVTLVGPRRRFGEHEIYHSWNVGIEGVSLDIYSGGYFYRKSTGGDSFTSMRWTAEPGQEPDYSDYLGNLGIVDDAQPFDHEVAGIDLSDAGYSLMISDEDNVLLGEVPEEVAASAKEGIDKTIGIEQAGSAPVSFKPDFGLRLLKDGVSSTADHCFYDFRLYSLALISRGQYSTMVELPYGEEVYALSLDFTQSQLEQILAKASSNLRQHIMDQLSGDPATPRRIDFDGEVSFGVRARLGTLQRAQKESFVPLVAQEIL